MSALLPLTFVALAILLLVAAVTDLRSRRIPNWLTVTGFAVAMTLNALAGWAALGAGVAGAVIAFMLGLVLLAMGGMGGGDVKLMIAVGAFLGPIGFFWALAASALVGGIMSIFAAARGGILIPALMNSGGLLKHMVTLGRKGERVTLAAPGAVSVPYGVAIAIGTLASLWIVVGM